MLFSFFKKKYLKITAYVIVGGYLAYRFVKSLQQNSPAVNQLTNPTNNNGTDVGYHPLVFPMKIRKDNHGDGVFGASRKTRKHEGVDYETYKSQEVHAPFSGTITRLSYPYGTGERWRGLVLLSDDKSVECKIFYVSTNLVGAKVSRGQVIAFSQAISEKYQPTMKDHIHVEIRVNNVLKDADLFFK